MGFHLPHCSFHLLLPRACWQGLIKKNKINKKHTRPTPKCELILARILKHHLETNTILAHTCASPNSCCVFIRRQIRSVRRRRRPFPFRVPLVDKGEASAVDNLQKAVTAQPKKKKNSLMRIAGLALAHTAFLSGGSFCFRFIFSGSSSFFFLPRSFCRVIFFPTSMRQGR